MLATENYGATRIGYSGNAESQRQYIFGWELQPEELFPDEHRQSETVNALYLVGRSRPPNEVTALRSHRAYHHQHRAIVFFTSLGTGRMLHFGWLVICYHLGAFATFLFSMTLFAEPRRQSFCRFKDRCFGHCEGQPRSSYP